MKKIITFLLFISLCMGMIGCSSKKEVTLGSLDGEKYTNDYFGIEITVPEEWTKLDAQQQQELMNLGQEAIAGDDEKLNKQLDLAEEKVLNFMIAFKYPLDEVHTVNPSIACNAEKLSFLQGIKNGEEYLEMSKELLAKAQIPYEFDEDIYTENLGGQQFSVLKVNIDAGAIKLYQKYYTKIIDGYAFNIIVTYSDEEEKEEVEEMLNSVKFN